MEITPILHLHKQENGDAYTQFWNDWIYNIQRIEDLFGKVSESHNLNTFSASGDEYRKLMTFPGQKTWEQNQVLAFIGNDKVDPRLEKVTSTTFYLYMPINSGTLTVVYV